jgi:thymidine kinase
MTVGKFNLITGPMFSGKTEELLRIANLYKIANKKILICKPKKDDRYGESVVCTHSNTACTAKDITYVRDIFPVLANSFDSYDAIFIDEFQFLEDVDMKDIFVLTEEYKVDVYVCGLVLDSFRKPFESMEKILPYASVTEFCAVCDNCGNFEGKYTFRLGNSCDQVYLGGKDTYNALCKDCFLKLS